MVSWVSRSKRSGLLVLAVLLLLGCASGVGVLHAPVVGPAATRVIVFQPPDAAAATVAGYCWTASLAVARAGAWRCMAGNLIYDPCFGSGPDASVVICTKDPADPRRAVRLSLARPLPAVAPRSGRARAWALQLADGAMCTYMTGATGPVDGQRINFGCSNGRVVVGDPTPGRVWTVREVLLAPRSLVVEESARVSVAMAWE
jgi:hypothetical protein